eukprot:364682-Chlamydomonas_euryale.AAC.15
MHAGEVLPASCPHDQTNAPPALHQLSAVHALHTCRAGGVACASVCAPCPASRQRSAGPWCCQWRLTEARRSRAWIAAARAPPRAARRPRRQRSSPTAPALPNRSCPARCGSPCPRTPSASSPPSGPHPGRPRARRPCQQPRGPRGANSLGCVRALA